MNLIGVSGTATLIPIAALKVAYVKFVAGKDEYASKAIWNPSLTS